VRNIRTITNTMQLAASLRYRSAQARVLVARGHTDRISDIIGDLMQRGGTERLEHPLLQEPEGARRDLLLVLTSNRGLCGGYNLSVLRTAAERHRQLVEADYEVVLWASGRRGVRWLESAGFEIDRVVAGAESPRDYGRIAQLAEELMGWFIAGRISGLEVAYMQYVSSSRQGPAISQILPMEFVEPPRGLAAPPGEPVPYEFMPSAAEVLAKLLPAAARSRLWQCFLDAAISEQVMRVAAMKAATDNADEMIHDLTVRYNRSRQAQITAELAEIMGGREGAK